jgi:hypothetical protein
MANFMKKGPKVPKVPKPVAKAPVKTENIESEVTEEEIPKSAEKKLEVISEVIEEQKVVAAQEKVEEVEEEIVDQEEDDKIEDKVEEEIIEDANKEEVKAPVKSKAKAKSSKKKAQPKQDKVEDPNVVMITDIEDIESIIAPQLLPEPEGWKEEKERINELVNKTMITEELDPTSVRSLLQDMSTAYREIAIKAEEANTFYDNLQDQIKHIREKNYIGSNAEERKLNSANSVSNYINENGECVDLMSYSYFARARASFYNSALKNVETNRQMLITFSSVFKIELSKAY